MNRQKIRNYVGQILELTTTIKNQPPSQRYGACDGIAVLARSIRNEVDADATQATQEGECEDREYAAQYSHAAGYPE